jgi:hypothetical protein
MSPAEADEFVEANLVGFLETNPEYSKSDAREALRDIYLETTGVCEDSDDSDLIWSAYREDCESGDCDCCDTDEDASR